MNYTFCFVQLMEDKNAPSNQNLQIQLHHYMFLRIQNTQNHIC